jgi:hypothetical protein
MGTRVVQGVVIILPNHAERSELSSKKSEVNYPVKQNMASSGHAGPELHKQITRQQMDPEESENQP